MGYQESLLIVNTTKDFPKVCEILERARQTGKLQEMNLNIVEIGKFRKRLGVYPKDSCFIWLTGDRGNQRDLTELLGEADFTGLSKEVSICFCEDLPINSIMMDLKTIKVIQGCMVAQNNLVVMTAMRGTLHKEVVDFIVNRKTK